MALPVLDYSTPRDDELRRRKRQEQSSWFRGALYAFAGVSGIMVVSYVLARRGIHGLGDSIRVILFCGLLLVIFGERRFRAKHSSTEHGQDAGGN